MLLIFHSTWEDLGEKSVFRTNILGHALKGILIFNIIRIWDICFLTKIDIALKIFNNLENSHLKNDLSKHFIKCLSCLWCMTVWHQFLQEKFCLNLIVTLLYTKYKKFQKVSKQFFLDFLLKRGFLFFGGGGVKQIHFEKGIFQLTNWPMKMEETLWCKNTSSISNYSLSKRCAWKLNLVFAWVENKIHHDRQCG